MFRETLPVVFILLSLVQRHAHAQSSPIGVGPLLTCDITTFACPGVNGCCTIGGCCGGGCCQNGYSCINEGTSDQACCPVTDPTLCGTKSPGDDNGSDSPGSGKCLGIDNCPRDPVRGLAWTCVLGEKCGLSYNECYPCVPEAGGDDDSSPTTSTSSPPSTTSDSSSSDSSNDSSNDEPSPSSNEQATTSSESSDSSSTPNSGRSSRNIDNTQPWLLAFGFWAAFAGAV